MDADQTTQSNAEAADPEWFVEGLRRALKRLNESISKGDVAPVETFVPLFETLHWIVAAKVESRLKGRDQWELARAIRFARNRVNHQWASALSLQDKPFPSVKTNVTSGSRIYYPPVVKMWCWVPVESLPVPEESRHLDQDVREPLYRDRLAGHLTLEALDAIAAAL